MLLGRKGITNLDSILKRRNITLPAKVYIVKAMVFPVVIYVWDNWTIKNWCFQTVVLKKILESPLDSMKVKPINPEGDQPWIFIGRTDAEALILWPPDEKRRLIGKDPNAGKDWGQEEKGATEDEWLNESGDERMRWVICQHHQLSGHKFEQTPGDGEGQGTLVCCSSWICRVRHNWATEQQQ